jgi:hypothetical protein
MLGLAKRTRAKILHASTSKVYGAISSTAGFDGRYRTAGDRSDQSRYPVEFSMLALAETVVRLTDSSSKIEFRPLPPDDPKQRQPNISRAKQVLGWEPRWQLEDGLKRTIAYFQK